MKKIIYSATIALLFSCKNGHDEHQSIHISDNQNEYNFAAEYPKNKTERVEEYLDSTLKIRLLLNKPLDTTVSLGNGEYVALKASAGYLKINFPKNGSRLNGYQKVKRLANDIKLALK